MSKINQKQTLSLKYASSLLDYIIKQDTRNMFNPLLFPTFENISSKNPFKKIDREDLITIETLTDELRFLNFYILETKNFFKILTDPTYSSVKKIELINSALPGLHPLTKAFIKIIGEKNHLYLLPQIVTEYNKLLHKFLEIKYVTLIFSCVPKSNQLAKIKEKLFEIFKMNQLVLQILYDSSILGGFVVYEGSNKIDLSLKGKLNRIVENL